MIRRVSSLLIAVTMLLVISGCRQISTNRLEPSLPGSFGARITGGQLHIWTGSLCTGTTRIDFEFDWSQDHRAELILQTPSKMLQLNPPPGQSRNDIEPDPGVDVEHLTFGGPYPGFEFTRPLPPGFDWHDAQTLGLMVDGELHSGGAETDLAEVKEHSNEHPEDTYWFQGIGWLNAEQVAAQDGKTFLALCTPDPARDPDPPRVFGVRVTDGTLRFWTGPYCGPVEHVIVSFQPGQAALVLKADPTNKIPFESLTLADTYPGFAITRPLPAGFDWRTRNTAYLRVLTGAFEGWTIPTDLAKAGAESTQHPDNSYWFQGFGWLNPTQVAERDGKDFLTACAREHIPK